MDVIAHCFMTAVARTGAQLLVMFGVFGRRIRIRQGVSDWAVAMA